MKLEEMYKTEEDILLEELLYKIEILDNDCWKYLGRLDGGGYGRFKHELAHRESYKLYKGDIPKGLYVLHKCNNPSCCNPDHLYAGTAKQNTEDMIKSGRAVWQNEEIWNNKISRMYGRNLSEETKNKICNSVRGKNNGMYGKYHSDETKQKIKEAKLGKHLSDETKQKIREAKIGKNNINHKSIRIGKVSKNEI